MSSLPPRCCCQYCRCTNNAQEDPTAQGLCGVCERAEIWGKNDATYGGCKCTCRCRLRRAGGELLCEDCGAQNRLDPRGRHRVHGLWGRRPRKPPGAGIGTINGAIGGTMGGAAGAAGAAAGKSGL
ncbi:hypothetical protein GGR56DRAFT_673561 [Xylariaceae sp. FL0804]|nr:hypothetical protein GGR56DRAFT_673561 [Xylariaceae sp. FL0804]